MPRFFTCACVAISISDKELSRGNPPLLVCVRYPGLNKLPEPTSDSIFLNGSEPLSAVGMGRKVVLDPLLGAFTSTCCLGIGISPVTPWRSDQTIGTELKTSTCRLLSSNLLTHSQKEVLFNRFHRRQKTREARIREAACVKGFYS